ncbi:unnamed protein product [Heterosigma akashiwo]
MDRAHDSRRCEPKRCSNNDAAVQCHENIETGTWHSRSTKTNEFQAPDPRGRGAVPAVDAARGHRLRRGGADQEDTDELGAERGLGGRAAVRLHGLHRLHHHLLGGVDAADGDHGPADGRPVPAPRRCRGQHRPDGGPAGVLQRVVHGAGAEDPLLRAHLGALPGGQGLAPRTGGGGEATDAENFGLGAFAAGATVCLMIPLDTVKTRIVTQPSASADFVPYRNMVDCFTRVFREEGLGAFYTALPPRLASVVPMIGIQFQLYEAMKRVLVPLDLPEMLDRNRRRMRETLQLRLRAERETEMLESIEGASGGAH